MFARFAIAFILALLAVIADRAPALAKDWKFEPTVQNCEIGYIMNILRKSGHKAVATTGGRPLGVHPTACGCQKYANMDYPGKCTVIEVQ